jgi:predicted alpha/beta-fold hydrolase
MASSAFLHADCCAHPPPQPGVVIFVPGVGGDSRAGYINAAARQLLASGFNVCVLNPRGIAHGHRVQDVHNLYDALDLSDLHGLVRLLDAQIQAAAANSRCGVHGATNTTRNNNNNNDNDKDHHHDASDSSSTAADAAGAHAMPRIFLVGYSLGATCVLRYAHRMRSFVPSSVAAAVAVGGVCSSEVAEWDRYRTIYQRLIVPKIREEIASAYPRQLSRLMGGAAGLRRLVNRTTSYEHLVTNFILRVKQSAAARCVVSQSGWMDGWMDSVLLARLG